MAPSTSTNRSKSNQAVLAEKLAEGTQKHFGNTASLTFGDKAYTPAQVQTELQGIATMRNDVDTARAALKAKIEDEKAQAPTAHAFLVAFVAFVMATFGNSPDILADFGLQPKKARTPLTAEQRAAAKAKAAATRKARGTRGKKQKADITGGVTGVIVTPVTGTPAAPAAAMAAPEPQQPAPNAPAAPAPAAGGSANKQ